MKQKNTINRLVVYLLGLGTAALLNFGTAIAKDINAGLRVHEEASIENGKLSSELLVSYKVPDGLWVGADNIAKENYNSTVYGIFVPEIGGLFDIMALSRSVESTNKKIDDFHSKLVFHPNKSSNINFGAGHLASDQFYHLGYDYVGRNSGFSAGYLKREKGKDELRGYAWTNLKEDIGLLIGTGKYNDETRLIISHPSDDNGFGIRALLKYNVENYGLILMGEFTSQSQQLNSTTSRAIVDDDLHHPNSFRKLEKQNPFNFGPLWVIPSLERLGKGINGRVTYIDNGNNIINAELLGYIGETPWWIGINLKTVDNKMVRAAVEGGYNKGNFGLRGEVGYNPKKDNLVGRVLLETRF